jgi:hypothetical protein
LDKGNFNNKTNLSYQLLKTTSCCATYKGCITINTGFLHSKWPFWLPWQVVAGTAVTNHLKMIKKIHQKIIFYL